MKKRIFILIMLMSVFLISCGPEKAEVKEKTDVIEAETAVVDEDIIVVEEPESVETDMNTATENDMKIEESTERGEGVSSETEEQNPDETRDAAAGIFEKQEITDEIKQRINGLSYKSDCTVPYEDLRYLRVSYVDFGGADRTGEIICNKAIADDLLDIFRHLYEARYEIDKIRLVDEYGADDDLSCAEDNTSCFNFRTVEGSTNLSKHALGLAIDINPFYNPYVTYPGGVERISPPGSEKYADRSADFPHKIDKNDLAYKEFTSHGFKWGGNWKSLKDYQHFQKAD